MGIIRFLLAISVLVAHTNSFDNLLFVGAQNSVQLFYIISGFLISYILNDKKNYENSIIKFYFNRILRIYPIYIFVLILTVVYIFILNSFSSLDDDILAKINLANTNNLHPLLMETKWRNSVDLSHLKATHLA